MDLSVDVKKWIESEIDFSEFLFEPNDLKVRHEMVLEVDSIFYGNPYIERLLVVDKTSDLDIMNGLVRIWVSGILHWFLYQYNTFDVELIIGG